MFVQPIVELISRKDELELNFLKLKQENENYGKENEKLKRILLEENGYHRDYNLDKEFKKRNPKFENFELDFTKISNEFHELLSNINQSEKVFANLVTYEKNINDYFKDSDNSKSEKSTSDLIHRMRKYR
ncbi:MAG: hypothetical protein ACI85O_000355, partial [Saprospiraceae bacterium]